MRAALVVVAADSDGDAGRIAQALVANGHDADALRPALAAGVYSMVCASSTLPLGFTTCARSTRRPRPSISTRSRSLTIV